MIVFLLLKNKRNPLYKGLRLFSHCDPVGIQTQDLQIYIKKMIRTNNTLFLLDGIDYAELCLKCCYGMAVL